MSKKKSKKKSPLKEPQSLLSGKSKSSSASFSHSVASRFPKSTTQVSFDREWVENILKRELSIDEFNKELNIYGWSVSLEDGHFSKRDENDNLDEHTGMMLTLRHSEESCPMEFFKYDSENSFIPREIYEAISDYCSDLVEIHESDDPIAGFNKIFDNSDSQFFITSDLGDIIEIY